MSARMIASKALPARKALFAALSLGILGQVYQVALLATSAWLITRAAEQPPFSTSPSRWWPCEHLLLAGPHLGMSSAWSLTTLPLEHSPTYGCGSIAGS
jgi:hypothetical protein